MFRSPVIVAATRRRQHGSGGAFSPSSLSPALWYEAAQSTLYESNAGSGTQPSANGDPVGYMADLSGNGRHVTSLANDTTRPTLNGVGSKPYVAFAAASSQTLVRTTGLGLYANGAMSMFAAFQPNPATQARFFCEGNSATANSIESWLTASGASPDQVSFTMRGDDGTTLNLSPTLATSSGTLNNTAIVYGSVWDGTDFYGYKNGTVINSVSLPSGVATLTTDRFSIGSLYRSSAGNFFTANLYGLVVVKRVLTSQEISDLTTYMGDLAGLSL